ncbi:MAG: flagellar filament capping protein FliD [Idiomarinaceae bacterium]|uniref:flagellar filament capping protein FliD n=1 Tax=Idiomarina sp. 28-8 TaxID=1260624 RepID=UPI0002D4E252|nr:flagellar filament capping protein FliD [Idiomarina sp. 28-8]NWO02279.1 flagellar filament capping protein FliD [Idiomarinaceae bacterium]
MGISSLGVGSGLALEDLVTQLVQAERTPKLEALQQRQNTVDVSLSGYSKLKSALSKVEDSLELLSNPREMNSRTALINGAPGSASTTEDGETTTTNAYLSATANSNAPAASYNISVEALAQGSKAKSGAFTSASEVISSSAGTLTFATENGENSFDVAVEAGATLQDIANTINSNNDNYGVSASIVNTGGTNPESRLVFSSSITGADNELVVTNDNAELDALSTVASGGTAGMTIAAEDQASDAKLIVDGIEVFSSTNTFSDAIGGVELTAKEVSAGDTQKVEVTTDKQGVKDTINSFVESYNGFMDVANALTNVNVEGQNGALVGDSMLRGLRSGLNNILGGSVASAEVGANTMYSIGLTFEEDGKIGFVSGGEEKLDQALEEDFDKVSKLFSNDDGLGAKLDSYIKQYTQTGGLFETKTDVFDTQKKDIKNELEDFNQYMEGYEQNLREEYQALDSMIARMNQTMSSLQGQLGSLPGFGGNS